MDVLDRVLDLPQHGSVNNNTAFIASGSFKGKREGYVFKMGANGVGYYLDKHPSNQPTGSRKREREYEIKVNDEDEDGTDTRGSKIGRTGNKIDISKLVDEAEDIKPLNNASLKLLLFQLEKKINNNQQQRIKYAHAPEKFMESEMELHAAINDLYSVAASPELYSALLQADSMTTILGLITHENSDVSLASVGLLQEMTDTEALEGEEHFFFPLLDKLVELQGLELVVLNLSRLDESNDEDAQGVFTTLTLIENLITLRPGIATLVCERTHILKFLAERIQPKTHDANKLYSSELLSILLQSAASNQKKFLLLQDVDGMEIVLQSLALYRKSDPSSPEEAEVVQNLFLSLCALLMSSEGQNQFRSAEGFELMVRFLKEQKFAAAGSIKAINFAILNNGANCLHFVKAGGLRYAFPLLMGIGLPKAYMDAGKSSRGDSSQGLTLTHDTSKKEVLEIGTAIVGQLVLFLYNCNELDASTRLLGKFVEDSHEKLLKCVEMFGKTAIKLQNSDRGIQIALENAIAAGDEEAVEEYMDEDALYEARLAGGLYMLQQLAFILGYVYITDSTTRSLLDDRMEAEGGSMQDILAVLREWAGNMAVSDDNAEGGVEGRAMGSTQRQTVILWCAALGQVLEAQVEPTISA